MAVASLAVRQECVPVAHGTERSVCPWARSRCRRRRRGTGRATPPPVVVVVVYFFDVFFFNVFVVIALVLTVVLLVAVVGQQDGVGLLLGPVAVLDAQVGGVAGALRVPGDGERRAVAVQQIRQAAGRVGFEVPQGGPSRTGTPLAAMTSRAACSRTASSRSSWAPCGKWTNYPGESLTATTSALRVSAWSSNSASAPACSRVSS